MRYSHRADNERQPEVVSEDVVQAELSRAQLRTKAIFEAEQLLRLLSDTEPGTKIPMRFRGEAGAILMNFPTKFELMRMAESHPMLDAAIAQRMVTQRDHLPMEDPPT